MLQIGSFPDRAEAEAFASSFAAERPSVVMSEIPARAPGTGSGWAASRRSRKRWTPRRCSSAATTRSPWSSGRSKSGSDCAPATLEHQADVEVQAAVRAGRRAAGSSGQAQAMRDVADGQLEHQRGDARAVAEVDRPEAVERVGHDACRRTPPRTRHRRSGTAGPCCAGCAGCRPAAGTGPPPSAAPDRPVSVSGAGAVELEAADGGVAAGEEALDLGQQRAPRPAGTPGRSASCGAGPCASVSGTTASARSVVLRNVSSPDPERQRRQGQLHRRPAASDRASAPAGCPGAATRPRSARLPTVVGDADRLLLGVRTGHAQQELGAGDRAASRRSARRPGPGTSPGRSRWCPPPERMSPSRTVASRHVDAGQLQPEQGAQEARVGELGVHPGHLVAELAPGGEQPALAEQVAVFVTDGAVEAERTHPVRAVRSRRRRRRGPRPSDRGAPPPRPASGRCPPPASRAGS